MATVAVGSDHAGFLLKEQLAGELRDLGYDVLDLGTHSTDRVDYPDFGAAVGQAVAGGRSRTSLFPFPQQHPCSDRSRTRFAEHKYV